MPPPTPDLEQRAAIAQRIAGWLCPLDVFQMVFRGEGGGLVVRQMLCGRQVRLVVAVEIEDLSALWTGADVNQAADVAAARVKPFSSIAGRSLPWWPKMQEISSNA
jgi:hypothetical protein